MGWCSCVPLGACKLCRPFLSGSNTLPVKTVLLLSVLKTKAAVSAHHGSTEIWGQGVKASYGRDGINWVLVLEINS